MKICSMVFALTFSLVNIMAKHSNPEELGKVNWLRDLAEAEKKSVQTGKPILILFQEIPGCSTCKQYGNQVLSHPLLVEAIETLFVPLAIYNNRKGKDEKVLKYYQEPSWNNPVVRIVGADKKDILPRLNGNYSPAGLATYMIEALNTCGKNVPVYLSLISEELEAAEKGIEKTTLSMYCFWTGEKEFGKLNGVVHTEAGFMDGREVVNVFYNPGVIGLDEVISHGSAVRCADRIYVENDYQVKQVKKIAATKSVQKVKTFRMDRAPKYYLSKTAYQYLPMSPLQAVRANSLVGQKQSPLHIFSPRQLKMLDYFTHNPKGVPAIHHQDWHKLFFEVLATTGES